MGLYVLVMLFAGIVQGLQSISFGEKNSVEFCHSAERARTDYNQSQLSQFREAMGEIHLGDSKDRVLSLLSALESAPPTNYRRNTMRRGREQYEISDVYYFRTSPVPYDCPIEDEFTPFIFQDEVLVSIGWRMLDGPHSFPP
jgi:hypothetical protein